MSIYGVTGVRLDNKGVVSRVQLCQVNPMTDEWIGQAREMDAHDAADMILQGNRLISIFIVKEHGGTVPGADFRYASDEHGRETIELDHESEGKALADLVLE